MQPARDKMYPLLNRIPVRSICHVVVRRNTAPRAKEQPGMKFWLIGITAALSLMAIGPDYSLAHAAAALAHTGIAH
jgi:hypothetical protein